MSNEEIVLRRIYTSILRIANDLGFYDGENLNADAVSADKYSLYFAQQDLEKIAKRSEELGRNVSELGKSLKKIADCLKLEKDVHFYARRVGAKNYIVEQAVIDAHTLEVHASAVQIDREIALKQSLELAMFLSVITNPTKKENDNEKISGQDKQ